MLNSSIPQFVSNPSIPFCWSVDIENPGLEAANSQLESPQATDGRSGRIRFRPVWMGVLRLSLGRGGAGPHTGISAARLPASEARAAAKGLSGESGWRSDCPTAIIREATASGHGIGKSALVA